VRSLIREAAIYKRYIFRRSTRSANRSTPNGDGVRGQVRVPDECFLSQFVFRYCLRGGLEWQRPR
jgi:hypothetical protein